MGYTGKTIELIDLIIDRVQTVVDLGAQNDYRHPTSSSPPPRRCPSSLPSPAASQPPRRRAIRSSRDPRSRRTRPPQAIRRPRPTKARRRKGPAGCRPTRYPAISHPTRHPAARRPSRARPTSPARVTHGGRSRKPSTATDGSTARSSPGTAPSIRGSRSSPGRRWSYRRSTASKPRGRPCCQTPEIPRTPAYSTDEKQARHRPRLAAPLHGP